MLSYKTFDGREYVQNEKGTVFRVSPLKPWRNKAARKAHIKARREAQKVVAATNS